MKKQLLFASLLAYTLCYMPCTTEAKAIKSIETHQTSNEFSAIYKDVPFEMPSIQRPSIPALEVAITEFGAVNDGTTKNTEAFAKAMKHLVNKGGGHIIVPAGIWYTGPIEFESNVDLHLETGALILFSEDKEDYKLVESCFEGLNTRRCMSPLFAVNKKNISISGFGTFNGNGQQWRPVKKGKMTEGQWKDLCKEGALNDKKNVWYPSEKIREIAESSTLLSRAYSENTNQAWAEIHDFLRPALLQFINCENVILEDATFENSPGWNIHPLMCKNLILNRINVRNPWYAQNGDGLDAESCTNVIVNKCTFDVGDDAICIKSGKDKDGRDRGIACANVIIDGCTVYHGHGGFVIGSEMSGGANNILVNNCLFLGTDVGLRFKSTRGRGGVVENIYIRNINMINIPGDAMIFDLYYGIKPGAPVPEVSEETPRFQNMYIDNIVCRGATRAMYFNGLPEMPIKNIHISNTTIHSKNGATLNEVDGITLENVNIVVEKGEKFMQNNATNVVIK